MPAAGIADHPTPSSPAAAAPGRARAAGLTLPVVVLTTFFPNPRDPCRTPFMRNLVRALGATCDVHIVAPVPRRPAIGPWRETVDVPAEEVHEGFRLRHPRYLAVPGLHALSGLTYYLAVLPTLRAMQRTLGDFVLHAHCGYPDAVGAALAARALDVPLVVTVHGSDINASARQALLRPQIRWALRHARRVVAVSRPLQDEVARLTARAPERLACIPCAGFHPDAFHPRPRDEARARLGVPPGERVVLFVGHLVPVKGLDVLVEAWARRRAHGRAGAERLVLVGEGAERGRLERRAREAQVADSVQFVGPLAQSGVADWLAASDLLCLPSRSEGSPNVVVEALASGIPVVASRVGGVPDLVRDGVTGLLVPPGDAQALAAALAAALERRWEPQALAQSVRGLTWSAVAARNEELLAGVAAERAK
jgi:glycosyltransferase involved in cell wall biosynthesis